MVREITIIGGGASGLVAAINLAQKGHNVTILESKPRIGQKILVAGNGRCNLTNLSITRENYHSNNLDAVERIVTRYGCAKVLDFFKSIGLFTRSKGDLVYPLSNKASSVLDLLRAALAKYNARIITDFEVDGVEKNSNGYIIKSNRDEQIKTDKLIVATGSKAYNGTDIGIKILKQFGHRINKIYPALVQLRSNDQFIKGLKGVKFDGEVRVYRGGDILRAERGEILFTDYGISGIAIMQVSYLFSMYDDCRLELDFLPDMSLEEVKNNLAYMADYYQDTSTKPEEYLTGLLDKKLGMRIIKHSDLENLKTMPIQISGHNGYKNAQVCGGGAALEDFHINNLESHHSKGLYAIGEVLDAIGDCGGYNLHWAFACGLCVGREINE